MSRLNIIGKSNKTGQLRLLFTYFCIDRRYFATGVTIPKEDFNPDKLEKPVRASNPNAAHFNQNISLLYHEIQQIISTLRREDKVPAADLVFRLHQDKRKIELQPVNNKTPDLIFAEFMDQKSFSQSTANLYNNMWSQLRECYPNLVLEEFTINHWTQFRNFLKNEKGHAVNTTVIRLNKLKAMLKYLKSEGFEIPIASFPLPKEEIKKVFMDLKDLQKVIDYIPLTASLQQTKELFLIQCHTALRISDLKRLSRDHFKEIQDCWFISMSAYKTNKPLMIPLNRITLDIVRKFNFRLTDISEPYYNREIKKLIKLAGITTTFEWQSSDAKGKKVVKKKFLYEIFTNHCCSRTAIKYFFSLGYAPDQVARIVGKSMDTIMGYYYEAASQDDIIMRTKQFVMEAKQMISG